MDLWNLILYAVASFLALQSLISLMSHHRQQFRRQMAHEYQQQQESAAKAAQNPPAEAGTADAAETAA